MKGLLDMASVDILQTIDAANKAFDAYIKKQAAKENAMQADLMAAQNELEKAKAAPPALFSKSKKDIADFADNEYLNMAALAKILNVSLPTARKIAKNFETLLYLSKGKRARICVKAGEVKDFLAKGGVDCG